MKQKNKKLAQIYHYDLYGKRDEKYKFLDEKSVNNIEWNELEYKEPYYFFVPKDFEAEKTYSKGFKIENLMKVNIAGIETIRDSITIHFKKEELESVLFDFNTLSEIEIAKKYKTKDSRDWKIGRAKNDVIAFYKEVKYQRNINYRPFDLRLTYYTGKQNGFVCNGRYNVMRHMLNQNIGLIAKRGFDEDNSMPTFISNKMIDRRFWSRPGMQGAESIFPLYLYPEAGEQATLDQSSELTTPAQRGTGPSFGHPSRGEELGRKPNFDIKLVGEIAKGLGLEFRDVAPWDSTTPSFGHPSYRRGISNIFHHFISHLWRGVRRTEWSYATITHHSTPTLSTSFISLSVSVRATIIFW